jgi:2-dehydro-3-deoxyphosphogluconate aldolase/(4S)-4-hydroxy-2-oxoglutarate aldolase
MAGSMNIRAKEEIHQRIVDIGIIPVLRVSSPALAIAAAEAVWKGGVTIVEVTMTVPKAIDVIRKLVVAMGSDVTVGAGTVLDTEAAEQCIHAGAEFLVSPVLNSKIAALARREGKLFMAGALTPNEVVSAWDSGSDFVKVFPCGNVGGPRYIRALKGPLPHIPLVPTGGVNLDTAKAYIAAGASAIGVGGDLISESELAAGNHEYITAAARQFMAAVREARPSSEGVAAVIGKGGR